MVHLVMDDDSLDCTCILVLLQCKQICKIVQQDFHTSMYCMNLERIQCIVHFDHIAWFHMFLHKRIFRRKIIHNKRVLFKLIKFDKTKFTYLMKVSKELVILMALGTPNVYKAHRVLHDDIFFRTHMRVHQNKRLHIRHLNHLDFCNHKYCIHLDHTGHTLHLVHTLTLVQLGNNFDHYQKND